jgi:TRAP-type C4-dicarboxylate transport system permease small subunit
MLAGLVFLQVFTRYVLNSSLSWTEEMASYLLIAVVFLGLSRAVRSGAHIRVEFFYRCVSAHVARILTAVANGLSLLFAAYASVLAWKVAQVAQGQRMSQFNVPRSAIYYAVMVGLALMAFRLAQTTWREWRNSEPLGATGGQDVDQLNDTAG